MSFRSFEAFEATQVVRACLRLACAMCGGLVIFCWFGRAKLTHLLLPDEPVTQAIFAKLLICGWASSTKRIKWTPHHFEG